MADYNLKVDVEPTDKYEKAKKDLITAFNSFHELSQEKKEQLIRELVGIQASQAIFELMNLMNNRK